MRNYLPQFFYRTPPIYKNISAKIDALIKEDRKIADCDLLEFKRKFLKLNITFLHLEKKDYRVPIFETKLLNQINSGLLENKHSPTLNADLRKEYLKFKNNLKESNWVFSVAIANLMVNMLFVAASVFLLVGAGALLVSGGPIGWGILCGVMALSFIAAFTYSAYVEGHYLTGKPFDDIEAVLDVVAPLSPLTASTAELESIESRDLDSVETDSFVPA